MRMNLWYNLCRSAQTAETYTASLTICYSIPPSAPRPSFTFRQLQIQLSQLVSNLFRQGGQIHDAVRHGFADKLEWRLVEKKPGCCGETLKKIKTKPLPQDTKQAPEWERQSIRTAGPSAIMGETHQRQRAVT